MKVVGSDFDFFGWGNLEEYTAQYEKKQRSVGLEFASEVMVLFLKFEGQKRDPPRGGGQLRLDSGATRHTTGGVFLNLKS